MADITWEPRKIKLADLKENQQNPKIITDIGRKRLNVSVGKWGLAGTILVNLDMRIIDGHSRIKAKELEEKGIKEVWASFPSRILTDKEYDEFNALHDIARAGTPDTVMMEETLSEEVQEEMVMDEKGGNKKGWPSGSALKYLELTPYKKTHILLSFPPEKMIDVQPLLEKILEISSVEYEQANN